MLPLDRRASILKCGAPRPPWTDPTAVWRWSGASDKGKRVRTKSYGREWSLTQRQPRGSARKGNAGNRRLVVDILAFVHDTAYNWSSRLAWIET